MPRFLTAHIQDIGTFDVHLSMGRSVCLNVKGYSYSTERATLPLKYLADSESNQLSFRAEFRVIDRNSIKHCIHVVLYVCMFVCMYHNILFFPCLASKVSNNSQAFQPCTTLVTAALTKKQKQQIIVMSIFSSRDHSTRTFSTIFKLVILAAYLIIYLTSQVTKLTCLQQFLNDIDRCRQVPS